jgi:spore coat protein U-like protein
MKKYHMKKLAFMVAALGAMGLGAEVSEAAPTASTFNVNITLTSVCTMSSITNVDFAYVANQGGVANATGGDYSVTCTNQLPFNVALQAGTGGAYPGVSSSITVTDGPTQLQYQLTTTAPTAALGGTGTGLPVSYKINGTMNPNQWGCAGGSCVQPANNIHTLWVNY